MPLSRIRVNDLCNRCGIHRRTFYNHFRDVYDLTAWIFNQTVDAYLPGDSGNPGTAGIIIALERLKENAPFFRVALQEDSQNALGRHILNHDIQIYEKELQRITGKTDISRTNRFAIRYYCYGSLGTIYNWLFSGCQLSPEEMADLMISVMPPVLHDIFGRNSHSPV